MVTLLYFFLIDKIHQACCDNGKYLLKGEDTELKGLVVSD